MESSSHHIISNDYTELYHRLPFGLKLAYGTGHVLNDICASMWFTYLLVFFHLVLEYSNFDAGLLLLVGQIADALSTPLVGYHSDQSGNCWICKYGKRKIWHLIGSLCVISAFPFIFSPCFYGNNTSHMMQLTYYSFFIILFQFGWAAVQISHLSLIPELTPNEHDRTQLTAIRYCFTVVASIFVYIITWMILHLNSGDDTKLGPADQSKFQHIVWIGLGVGIFASGIFHCCVNENDGPARDIRGGQLRTSVGEILKSFNVYKVAVIYMTTRLFVNLTQVFMPLYLHESLDMKASKLALIPLVMFIGSFLMSFSIGPLNKLLGRKLAYLLGFLFGSLACLWIKLGQGDYYNNYGIYGVAVLIGMSGSIILVTSLSITADLIGDKTGSGAFVYGVMSFTDKLANGIAVIVIQDLHKDASNLLYYRDILTYVCGGSLIIGTLGVLSLVKMNGSKGLSRQGRISNYNSINSEISSEERALIS